MTNFPNQVNNMRIFFLTFLLCLLGTACGSAQISWNPLAPTDGPPLSLYKGIEVDRQFGCAHYRGKERSQCLDTLIKEYELVRKTAPTETILKEKSFRRGEYYYRVSRVCYSQYLCHERTDKIYEPSLGSRIIKFAIGVGTGLLIAVFFI